MQTIFQLIHENVILNEFDIFEERILEYFKF